ncbi:MAG: CoA transferase [Dehalococcoidales bacterium]|nr:CoA transferase [Dehalococcoidales bacterium]
MAELPLEGIRVVDITVIYAGPFAAMNLADWGAEVIRVESLKHFQVLTRGGIAHPPQDIVSNPTRTGGLATYCGRDVSFRPWNRWTLFNAHARNKLGCTMDLTQPGGKELFKRLIAVSDVFLESNAPHVVENFGLTYDVLKEVNPKLIMLSMPGFGNSGPYKYYRALGVHQEGFIGHTYLRGYPDSDPSTTSTLYHADEASGASAALAVLMALHYRNRTGKGQYIDMSQAEATMPHLGEAIMDYSMNRRVQTSTGNRLPGAAPCGCYRCQGEDRWINITVTSDEEWQGLCRVMGNPEWTRDERFSDSLNRDRHQDDMDTLIEEWTSQNNHYDLMFRLQKEGVPAGPVIFEDDAYTDPHLKERNFFQEVTHEECGTHMYPTFGFRMSRTPNSIRRPPVRLGEHNEYVYKEVLKVSDEEYRQLEEEGHIGMDYAPEIP